jgi:2'-5' RNA ligase
MEAFRCFIGISIDPALGAKICAYQNDLIATGADVKWVEPANIHISLKFLGMTPCDRMPILVACLRDIAREYPPFTIRVHGTGAFPRLDAARVLWIGVIDEQKMLARLAEKVERAATELGLGEEKNRFSPHITLGRVRSEKNKKQLTRALMREFVGKESCVKAFSLFKSTLSSKGPRYETLNTFSLNSN